MADSKRPRHKSLKLSAVLSAEQRPNTLHEWRKKYHNRKCLHTCFYIYNFLYIEATLDTLVYMVSYPSLHIQAALDALVYTVSYRSLHSSELTHSLHTLTVNYMSHALDCYCIISFGSAAEGEI